MTRAEHTREIESRQIKFGIDPAINEVDLPEPVDANDLANAIALEFADIKGDDYPLGPCSNGENGRNIVMAPGWAIRAVQRNRVRNAGEGSDFL